MRDTVVDWLTGRDTFYLIGAGCSRCAGKPLIAQLTAMVVEDVGESATKIFSSLKPPPGRDANIEDLMNHLIRRRDLLHALHEKEQLGELSKEEVDDLLGKIRNSIVKFIGGDWNASGYHARFLSRIRPKDNKSVRDVFTLNYDTLLEATLDELRIPYSDGFRGTGCGWFDPNALDDSVSDESSFRIHKLHGSISWRREKDDFVRRYIGVPSDSEAVLVYPSEQKYVETRFGVYETLMRRFRDRMRAPRPNNTLVTFGYSFNDDHINEAILDAVCFRNSNLTLFAFVGPAEGNSASEAQKSMFDTIHTRCGSRFNVFVGDNYARTASVEPSEHKEILNMNLWKFESAVDLIAGVPA